MIHFNWIILKPPAVATLHGIAVNCESHHVSFINTQKWEEHYTVIVLQKQSKAKLRLKVSFLEDRELELLLLLIRTADSDTPAVRMCPPDSVLSHHCLVHTAHSQLTDAISTVNSSINDNFRFSNLAVQPSRADWVIPSLLQVCSAGRCRPTSPGTPWTRPPRPS